MANRAAFEKWISGYGFSTVRRLGVYVNSHTVMAWNAWQAAHKYILTSNSKEI